MDRTQFWQRGKVSNRVENVRLKWNDRNECVAICDESTRASLPVARDEPKSRQNDRNVSIPSGLVRMISTMSHSKYYFCASPRASKEETRWSFMFFNSRRTKTDRQRLIFSLLFYSTGQVQACASDRAGACFCVVYHEAHVIERLPLENRDVRF